MDDCSPYSRVSPFRDLRIKGYLLLPEAFRSLSRLSSALSAKASTLRSLYLDLLILAFSIYSVILSALFLLRIFRYVFGCLTKSYLIYLLTMCSFQGTYWLSGSHCINWTFSLSNHYQIFYKSGSHLLSHAVSNIVPSADQVLTIVFGMWTGVTPDRIATRSIEHLMRHRRI